MDLFDFAIMRPCEEKVLHMLENCSYADIEIVIGDLDTHPSDTSEKMLKFIIEYMNKKDSKFKKWMIDRGILSDTLVKKFIN
jgi:hypothetical protein